MATVSLKTHLEELVFDANQKDALAVLYDWAKNHDRHLNQEVIMLNARFAGLQREINMGLLDQRDAKISLAQITSSLNYLIEKLPGNAVIEVDGKPEPKKPEEKHPASGSSKIYFSYAWGDDLETGESREKIIQELYESLKAEGYAVVKDKETVTYKDSISEFMRAIGRSDFIVVAISDKYLKSANCMFEMLQIYRKSNSDSSEFRNKIYPIVLADAKIYDPLDVLDYVSFWKQRKEKLENKILEIGISDASAVIEDFNNFKEITNNVGLISSMIKDMNTLKPQLLSKDNFETVKKAIQLRSSNHHNS